MKPLGTKFVIIAVIIVLTASITFFASNSDRQLNYEFDSVYTFEPSDSSKKPTLEDLQCEDGFFFDGYGCVEIRN